MRPSIPASQHPTILGVAHSATVSAPVAPKPSISPPQPSPVSETAPPAPHGPRKPKSKARKLAFLDGDLEWFAEQQNTEVTAPAAPQADATPTTQPSSAPPEESQSDTTLVDLRSDAQSTTPQVAEQPNSTSVPPTSDSTEMHPEPPPSHVITTSETTAAASAPKSPVEVQPLAQPMEITPSSAPEKEPSREESPDIPLMQVVSSPVSARLVPLPLPTIATLVDTSEASEPEEDQLASQSPHPVQVSAPLPKKKGRPPGLRNLPPQPTEETVPATERVKTPETMSTKLPDPAVSSSPTHAGSSSPSVAFASTSGSLSHKGIRKKKGRPPGIRQADLLQTDSVTSEAPPPPAPSLRIRIPPRSPQKPTVIHTEVAQQEEGPAVAEAPQPQVVPATQPQLAEAEAAPVEPLVTAPQTTPPPQEQSSDDLNDISRKRTLSEVSQPEALPVPQRRRSKSPAPEPSVLAESSLPTIPQALAEEETPAAVPAPPAPEIPQESHTSPEPQEVPVPLSQVSDTSIEPGEVLESQGVANTGPVEPGEVISSETRMDVDAEPAVPAPTSATTKSSPSPAPPEDVSSTNVLPIATPVYGTPLKIMGIAWGALSQKTSVMEIKLDRTTIEQLSRWANLLKEDM